MPLVKPKIIIITGPTSSGKSDIAIQLAKKFNGEIISADSRQIFQEMDLGTGKVTKDADSPKNEYRSEGIIHHLIDVVKPMDDFNVSHFKTLANEAIEKILQKGKLPIICGGTGFWIDSITCNTQIPEVAPNIELRKKLEQKNLDELFSELKLKDPERAKSIDSKNKVRLIRALEICEKLGKVPIHETCRMRQETKRVKYEFLEIGIDTPREILNEKIKKRLEMRFNQGMIKEVENLHERGVSFDWMERVGLEYRWISRYLQGKIELGEMSAKGGYASGAKEKLYFDIIHYAKRQMTWFKRNKQIIWLNNYRDTEKEVANFLQN